MKNPREFIKDITGVEITSENETDDCELDWNTMSDLMLAYLSYGIEHQTQKEN